MYKPGFRGRESVPGECHTCLGSVGEIDTQEYTGHKGELVICRDTMAKCPGQIFGIASSEEK